MKGGEYKKNINERGIILKVYTQQEHKGKILRSKGKSKKSDKNIVEKQNTR